jgi:hypothetical protein
MRKLNNPMPSGGAPFSNEDLNDVFQTEVWAAMQGLLSEYNADAEGVIVSGCVVSPNASNFDMTAGIVYLNGEFMRVDAVTNQTFTKYIKAAPVTNVARVFEDTVSKTFIVEKKAEVSATVDAGGQEITISSIASSLPRRLNNLKTGGLLTKVIDIGDWNMDANSATFVAHGLSNFLKIRTVSVMIRRDDDSFFYDLQVVNVLNGLTSGSVLSIGPTDIILQRTDTGAFDQIDFNATSFNRGWVTIQYLP